MMNKSNHCVIFIPGFKGSLLYDQNDKYIWPNFWRAQFSNATLNYHLPDLDLHNTSEYYEKDILKTISIIPYIYNLDYYGEFIKYIMEKTKNKMELITFHYDWRDHLYHSVTKLNNLLLKLKSQGIDKIDIICHSMGGLIASYLLRYENDSSVQNESSITQLINKIVFVATPFHGAIKSLHDIKYGSNVGLNRSLLSSKSLSSFPSAYYLLPLQNDAFNVNNNSNVEKHSLFDVEIWQKYQLSYLNTFINNKAIKKSRIDYLNNCLQSAKSFHAFLHNEHKINPQKNVKLILISGSSFNSLAKVAVDETSKEFKWHYENGDGSIPLSATIPPKFFSYFDMREYAVKVKHTEMFLAKEVQEICWREISETVSS